jgi:hypothetical protein
MNGPGQQLFDQASSCLNHFTILMLDKTDKRR